MTVAAAERVSHYYAPEHENASSPVARTREKFQVAKTAVTEKYRQFREPLAQGIPLEGIVFQGARTPEQRAESASEFWQAVREKKKLLDDNDPRHAEIKTALVIGGGGMAGIASAVMLESLRDHDLINTFDIIATDSASTANVACLLGSSIGSQMYIDLAQERFIRNRPGGMRLKNLMHKLMDNVDPEKIKQARPDWLIGITDEHGQKQHLEAKKLSSRNLFGGMYTSMAAPFAFNRRILMDDGPRTDGYLSGLSIAEALKRGSTYVGVMVNETPEELARMGQTAAPLRENLALRGTMWWGGYSRDVIHTTIDRRRAIANSLTLLDHDPNIKFDIMAPPKSVDWLSTDVTALTEVQTSTRAAFEQRLRDNGLVKN